jgi:hypothetical protein
MPAPSRRPTVNDLADKVDDLEREHTDAGTRIHDVETRIGSLETAIAVLSGKVDGVVALIRGFGWLLFAQLGIVLVVVLMLGALVGIRSVIDAPGYGSIRVGETAAHGASSGGHASPAGVSVAP